MKRFKFKVTLILALSVAVLLIIGFWARATFFESASVPVGAFNKLSERDIFSDLDFNIEREVVFFIEPTPLDTAWLIEQFTQELSFSPIRRINENLQGVHGGALRIAANRPASEVINWFLGNFEEIYTSDFSPETKTLIISLTQEALWSDGVLLSLKDVAFAIEYASRNFLENDERLKGLLDIIGALDYREEKTEFINGLSLYDDRLEIRFNNARYFPYLNAMPSHSEELLSYGPFVLTEENDEYISLTANEFYWRGRPFLDEIRFANYFELDEANILIQTFSNAGSYIRFNDDGILSDPRVRHALAFALDIQGFISLLNENILTPASSMISPFFWSELDYAPIHSYNPELAARLLDEAGFSRFDEDGFRLGINGEPLFLTLFSNDDDILMPDFFIENWAAIGIRVEQSQNGNDIFILYENNIPSFLASPEELFLEALEIPLLRHSLNIEASQNVMNLTFRGDRILDSHLIWLASSFDDFDELEKLEENEINLSEILIGSWNIALSNLPIEDFSDLSLFGISQDSVLTLRFNEDKTGFLGVELFGAPLEIPTTWNLSSSNILLIEINNPLLSSHSLEAELIYENDNLIYLMDGDIQAPIIRC